MRNRSTAFYFAIIVAVAIITGVLKIYLANLGPHAIKVLVQSLLLYSLPALWFGCIAQMMANGFKKNTRTLLNGTAYYGSFVALALFALQLGLLLATSL